MADTNLDINLENPELPDPKHPDRKKSAGELLFDRTVYTGIGFGVNEVSSLWITDQFMYGKNLLAKVPGLDKIGSWFSKEGFDRASESVAKLFKFTEQVAKDGSKIAPRERGANALLMVTLISGGTLLILPMKWIEDHKIYWVQKANHLVDKLKGNKLIADEVAARDAQVEKDIACTPRQSWPSMLVGRTIAVMSSILTGTFLVGPRNNEAIMNWSEKKLAGSLQTAGQRDMKHRYARLIGVETYSCSISSLVLEFMSKLFAKRGATPHDPVICEAAAAALPAATDSTTANTDTKEADCGCAKSHAEKIQAQKAQMALAPMVMQV